MKKILLITINKDSTPEELKQVARCISVETAHIEKIPLVGETFVPFNRLGSSGSVVIYLCLRSEEKTDATPCCDTVENHDAIVYASFSHRENG